MTLSRSVNQNIIAILALCACIGGVGCFVELPNGKIRCTESLPCPSGWSCVNTSDGSNASNEGLCFKPGTETGAQTVSEAGVQAGTQAGGGSGAQGGSRAQGGTQAQGGSPSTSKDNGPCGGGCLIDSNCYKSGETYEAKEPTGVCKICDPKLSRTAWSPNVVYEGKKCEDAPNQCYGVYTCLGVVCNANPKPISTRCKVDSGPCRKDHCNGSGNCDPEYEVEGKLCEWKEQNVCNGKCDSIGNCKGAPCTANAGRGGS